ncbi:response regulator [Nocardioides zeae]|uniref:Response regulator n=1 Tax=Nocardioides imazamoxiresistens TaxID=3231893 RepID=A0ABU3PXY6_9ACTN|nr:response regulator [Nocardioides zeae]MDT9594103.1 response regulator [Nocardioides zeae]
MSAEPVGRPVPSILFVEDDADVRALLELTLARTGLQVLSAATGAEGLQLARDQRPDLVSVDLGLPDMAGADLCRRLREFHTGPLVVVTAWASTRASQEAVAAGADLVIGKPFHPKELRRDLCRALDWTDAGARPA